MGWAKKIGMGRNGEDWIERMPDARSQRADGMDREDGMKKWGSRWKPADEAWFQPSTASATKAAAT